MGQQISIPNYSRTSSLSYGEVIRSKKDAWSEDRTLYNTPIYTRPSCNHVFTSPQTKPLPRGLQIMANNTVTLKKGFPYLKDVMMCYGIDKNDWVRFQQAMNVAILVTDSNPTNCIPGRSTAYKIELLLDVVAEWDVRFFRPKGIVMRMDMPGEEKYGLDFMDLFYKKRIVNASGASSREGIIEEYQKGKSLEKRQKHIDRARGRGYCSTRIVLDPVKVLQNKDMAEARGWTAWIKMCNEAKRRKARPLLPSRPNGLFAGDPRLRLRARSDRYPPSKHFFYDRFRGREDHVLPDYDCEIDQASVFHGHRAGCRWIPEEDSMDQRHGGILYRCTILPADDLPHVVVDDSHSISIASLMTRGFARNGNDDGTRGTPHWLAFWQESPAVSQSTCPWPDFPWPQGKGTERLNLEDG